jgi:hypothetical protein
MRNGRPRRPNAPTSTSAGPDTFEDRRRAGQSRAREPRREHGVARGFRVGEPLPVGERLHAGLPQRDMIVDGEADGLRELLGGELHQFPRRQRHRRQAEHRHIPAALGDVEGVDEPAIDLVGEHDRGDELLRARLLGFRDREASGDVIARMARETGHVGVVQVVVADRGAVGEGREIGRRAPIGADDGRGTTPWGQCDVTTNLNGLLVKRRKPAAERVDEMRFDPFDRVGIEIVIGQSVGVCGKPFGERSFTHVRRLGRIGLRSCNPGNRRKCRGTGRKMQELSSGWFHADAPLSLSLLRQRKPSAHVPAKWIPVRRQEHAPLDNGWSAPRSRGNGMRSSRRAIQSRVAPTILLGTAAPVRARPNGEHCIFEIPRPANEGV